MNSNTHKKQRHGREPSSCPLCHRKIELTFHHLIPKQLHRRNYFKKNYSKEELQEGVYICRQCHKGVHKSFTTMELAKSFNTLEKLQSDPAIHRHCEWVAKQRVN
jgi:5-methylcytosine-specific restriction endonuclease McrA